MPADADRLEVTRVVLAGIARAAPLRDLFEHLLPFLDYEFPFPADVLIELAADALTRRNLHPRLGV
jgi:hypothetical protein